MSKKKKEFDVEVHHVLLAWCGIVMHAERKNIVFILVNYLSTNARRIFLSQLDNKTTEAT